MKPRYFKHAPDFHKWLVAHHATARELWIGFYKQHSQRVGITYAEALDTALCFGWIDGLKKRVDESRFIQRFTPRRPKSVWSLVNIRHVRRLKRAGRMQAAGLRAFAARAAERIGIYSFEAKARQLSPAMRRQFQGDRAVWDFFQQQAPSYRRTAIFWVMNAKQEITRQRRLAQLIQDSKRGCRLAMLSQRKSQANLNHTRAQASKTK